MSWRTGRGGSICANEPGFGSSARDFDERWGRCYQELLNENLSLWGCAFRFDPGGAQCSIGGMAGDARLRHLIRATVGYDARKTCPRSKSWLQDGCFIRPAASGPET